VRRRIWRGDLSKRGGVRKKDSADGEGANASGHRILFLSHTNKLPQRTVNLISHFNAQHDVFLINWQRNAKQENNFCGVRHMNVMAKRSLAGLVTYYWNTIRACWNLPVDCGFCSNVQCLPVLILICWAKGAAIIYDFKEPHSFRKAWILLSRLKLGALTPVIASMEFGVLVFMRLTNGVLVVDTKEGQLLCRVRRYQDNAECVMNYPSKVVEVDEREVAYFAGRYRGRKAIVYAGTIFAEKGLFRYLEIIRQLKSYEPTVLLLMVGSFQGEEKKRIEKQLRDYGLEEYVEFLPWLRYGELLALLRTAYLGLSLLDTESGLYSSVGFGTARKVFTYMQAGIPVIVSSEVVGRFVEEKGVGRWVDMYDDQCVVESITGILCDDSLRIGMGRRGKALIENDLNWENELEKVIRVFERALAKGIERRLTDRKAGRLF